LEPGSIGPRAGHARALAEAFASHQPELLNRLRRRAGWQEAEDLSQQAFVEAAEALEKGAVTDVTLPLLQTIAERRRIDGYRRRDALEATFAGRPTKHHDGPLLAGEVSTALAALPSEERPVVLMRLIQGLAHREIAKRLEISEGASRMRLRRATRRLRERLATYGEAPASA
jgi:RNA polymerase sigma factor (sigma-70 family)